MSAHQYGPHRKEDQPQTVTVFRGEREGGDYQTEVPYAVRRGRFQVNQFAYDRAQAIAREEARRASLL